jgi:hypothetical protein
MTDEECELWMRRHRRGLHFQTDWRDDVGVPKFGRQHGGVSGHFAFRPASLVA